ncbi:MAG: sugar phosphate isomerase/epimerase [Acidobacteriota bacterium]|nr:sugar phosphate isomerase/epimerase [Acidobacteriota bacterium]
MKRRSFLLAAGAATATAYAQRQRNPMWQPKVGILVNYSESNIAFAKNEGFTSIGLWAQPGSNLAPGKATDAFLRQVSDNLKQSGLYCSVLGVTANHIDPDPEKRRKVNEHTAAIIQVAGQLGVPNIGTMSGKDPSKKLAEQADEIRRVYEEHYFPLCEKYKVRLVWEPWPEGPNVATGPLGYEALFKAFGDSPHVGIQFDPSHYVRQFMDPYQAARDWIDKIYDVHLKDTEIRYEVLRRAGINPPSPASWWRYRIPGQGQIDWPKFFTVLQDKGYAGAMNIEHEDDTYHPGYIRGTDDINDGYKVGFRVGLRYLKQFVPV